MISGTWPRAGDKTRDDIQHNLQGDTAFYAVVLQTSFGSN